MGTTSITSRLLLATAVIAGLATSARASEPDLGMRMPVPSDGIAGCWTSERYLYGSYRLRFCVNEQGDGSYTVSGGGLHCNARLDGRQIWGGGYSFTMSRSHCGGRGTDWTADSFTCQLKTDHNDRSDSPRIAVPTPTGHARLTCTYVPAVWGYPWTSFSANRA